MLRQVIGHHEGCFDAVADAQLLKNVGQMMLDGFLAQVEGVANFLVAPSLDEDGEDLPLARRQVRKVRAAGLHLDIVSSA